jgi:glucose/arabinose dehydrogenase
MHNIRRLHLLTVTAMLGFALHVVYDSVSVTAQATSPTMLDPNLDVRAVVTGLSQPSTMAFIGNNDLLVLEKGTGRVQRVVNGAIDSTVLDLAVNSGSERGLLGVALHPDFPSDPGVYLITLRALQPAFAAEPTPAVGRGNHDGGVLAFGPDGKLYIFIGDVGRRGQLQNLVNGPFGPGQPDDSFGGPAPDDAHLTGVILRLNADGTTPTDNPFFAAGNSIGGEVGENVQKVFSYGHRNSFGLAIDTDPRGAGNVWLQENGDDSFSELNRVTPGMNGGWVQIMGPVARIAQFKQTETTAPFIGLQQARWSPSNIADTPEEALSRLFVLPGATYSDPQFSWRFEVAPGGMNFLRGNALGPQFEGDLFMGAGTPNLAGGYLFHFNLTGNRRSIGVDDPRLEDRVADNLAKHEVTESESLLIGRDFGVTTDIETSPDGTLFIVSLTRGTIYEVFRR